VKCHEICLVRSCEVLSTVLSHFDKRKRQGSKILEDYRNCENTHGGTAECVRHGPSTCRAWLFSGAVTQGAAERYKVPLHKPTLGSFASGLSFGLLSGPPPSLVFLAQLNQESSRWADCRLLQRLGSLWLPLPVPVRYQVQAFTREMLARHRQGLSLPTSWYD
jgi:hypothetical protein